MPNILNGVRVLDFGRYIAGPLAAGLLADLGADVIRVERTKGGDDRFLMPVSEQGDGAMHMQTNRGKRAITLNMGAPGAAPVIKRLVSQADVVIANLSPAALRHVGLSYDALKAVKPDIILATSSAFGENNTLSEAIGFDGVGQAISGAIYLTGEPGKPYRSATSYVDFGTALSCAFGVLAALIRKMQTGEGSHVQASLACTAFNVTNMMMIEQATGANIREPTGNRSPIAGPSDVFAAADGWFIMQVIGDGMFKRWTKLVGRPDLLADPRYKDDMSRGRNGAELSAIMAEWCKARKRDECLSILEKEGLAGGPVMTPAEVMSGALGLSSVFFQNVAYPGTQGVPIAVPPAQFADSDSGLRRPPLLGEHTDAVFQEFGFAAEEVAALRREGVV